MSGFRIVRISDIRVVVDRPDFRRPNRSKSGQYCLDFKRSDNCIDQNQFQTGLEPVWNRFGLERLKSGRHVRISDVRLQIVRFGPCKVNGPDVRNPDV